jgi:urease accessory protein
LRPLAAALTASLAVTAFATPAWAHVNVAGLDGFSAGLLHPVLAPNQIMLLITAGLYGGQAGQRAIAPLMAGLLAGMTTGILAAALLPGMAELPYLWFLLPTVVLAALTAADRRLGMMSIPAGGIAAGLLCGHDVTIHVKQAGDGWLPVIGAAVAIPLIAFNLAWAASLPQRLAGRIAVRVIASWTGALSLLMLGLVLKQ